MRHPASPSGSDPAPPRHFLRTLLLGAALTLLTPGLAGTARAQSGPGSAPGPEPGPAIGVGVELVLAVDVSRSIDPVEQMIQRQGYADAFRSPEVQSAILNGGWGQSAVIYVEWAGSWSQTVTVPWTLIDSRAAAEDFAAAIERAPGVSASRTSIASALEFSAALFDGNGYAGLRRVIDVSGDGPNNEGRRVTDARDAVLAAGIVINGLPLMTDLPGDAGFYGIANIANLDRYFVDCVIGGPGSFAIPVTRWEDFAEAIQRKLVLELADTDLGGISRIERVQAFPESDCLIGEKMWEERQRRWGNPD